MKNKAKKLRLAGMIAMISITMAACSHSESASSKDGISNKSTEENETSGTQTIDYLDEAYEVPANVDKIATASLESMEDAAILGVKPAGAITVGGEIPDYLDMDLDGVEPIGGKKEPNYETLLKLNPDVIMWTTKSPANVTEQLRKVAPTFPYSHISSNWDDNLRLMAELTGKQDKAEEIITTYNEDAAKLRKTLGSTLQDQKVVMVRIRSGNIFLYPEDVYFNPVLYQDLGLVAPEEVKAAKAQEMISLEKLATMNPDYIFVQFADDENADQPQALEKLQKSPIWRSIQATKDDHVFVNAVDNLAQGGTAWSKTAFLKVVKDTLVK